MFSSLPTTAHDFMDWKWERIEPYFHELTSRELTADSISTWLANWTRLHDLLMETYWRLHVANTCDTTNREAEQRYHTFLDDVYPRFLQAEQPLKQKLIDSGLEPEDFELALRNMLAEAELFSEANLPLLAEEKKLSLAYNKIVGAQTIEWEDEEFTITQLTPLSQNSDRGIREQIWRLASERILADREAINDNWIRLMNVRRHIYENASLPDYRAYAWKDRRRFAYTSEDCEVFQAAIEEVVVPAAQRVYEKRRKLLGVDPLRPWDVNVNPMRTYDLVVDPRPPLVPFSDMSDLDRKAEVIIKRVDSQLGEYFEIMRREKLLDLDNRKGKAPGGYCTSFPIAKRPFIFMNAVGMHGDVQTMLHEAGHAIHVYEVSALPYHQQRQPPMEFAEVASTAMELLTAQYLTTSEGGFYADEKDAIRARIDHLEEMVIFWPYMAIVDAFQHWAYTNHEAATDPANCDIKWGELWDRFIVGVDWSGLEVEKVTGWQRKLHIHRYPFYYIEYGLAQVGALQVWRNALEDQAEAVTAYRQALALGGMATLPELFETAGAKFAFDADTMRELVDLIEGTITKLEDG